MAPFEADGSYHVFLSHSHLDAEWVEKLATRLEVQYQIRPWLDRWVLIPGKVGQREIARGLEQAASCAICLGEHTPRGWFEKEIEKALNRQAKDEGFRVIPVLLPSADAELSKTLWETFLDLNTWVDFRQQANQEHAFHLLVCGITGTVPGRWPPGVSVGPSKDIVEKLDQLRHLRRARLVDDSVALDIQRKILDRLLYF